MPADIAAFSGWLALGSIVLAATVPIAFRLGKGRRIGPRSKATRVHAALGLTTAALVFAHTLASFLSLGSAKTLVAGDLPLAVGALAVVVLFAHTGLGLQLRRRKLPDRERKRRRHLTAAITIFVAASIHAALLLRASS